MNRYYPLYRVRQDRGTSAAPRWTAPVRNFKHPAKPLFAGSIPARASLIFRDHTGASLVRSVFVFTDSTKRTDEFMRIASPRMRAGLFGLLIIAGCRDKTAPEPPTVFTAVVEASTTDTVTGPAIFGGSTAAPGLVRLASDKATLLIFDFGEPWSVGTYAIQDGGAVLKTADLPDYTGSALSGSITITAASSRIVAGAFAITFSREFEDTPVATVTGSFRAKCNPPPGMSDCE